MHLNKFIAHAGICARRKANTLILAGKININNSPITQLGYQVLPSDKVTYQGKLLKKEKRVYILLNKPRSYLTTLKDDRGRKTVMQLLAHATPERIYPIGRLDRDTTGLLLLTNHGDLAMQLAHPAKEIQKVYHLTLTKPIGRLDQAQVQRGLRLEDGVAHIDDLAVLNQKQTRLAITLHAGKNRIIRRIFAQLGYEITRLDRILYAGLTKKDLPLGKWRFLTTDEVLGLKHLVLPC